MLLVNPLPEFLHPLATLVRPFPREAVAEAIARRQESVPHLLQAIEWADQNTDEANSADPPFMLHLFAMFLLAQFREIRAYRPIVQLARNPDLENLVGDVITEDLGKILASVSGSNTILIESLIEDAALDEFVRGAALSSFGVLLHSGAKTRTQVSSYLGELFAHRLERESGHVWNSAITLCADFAFTEHLDAVRECYRTDLADPMYDTLADVEHELTLPPGASTRMRTQRYEFIDDTISLMDTWWCFDQRSATGDKVSNFDFVEDGRNLPGNSITHELPKIGRNDQCPCGSGKKFKKCCGASS